MSANGSSSAAVSPGTHVVGLRKRGYRRKQVSKQFEAGKAVELTDKEVPLESTMGKLQLLLSPAESQVTIRREGEAQRVIKGTEPELEEGSYLVTASAPKYKERSENVSVEAGKTRPVDLKLSLEVSGMEGWEDPRGWSKEDSGWFRRKGGGFVLYRIVPGGGTFAFTWLRKGKLLRGARPLRWVVNFIDDKNYVLFETNGKELSRTLVVNAREQWKSQGRKLSAEQEEYGFNISIEPSKLVASALGPDKKWISLDDWSDSSSDLTKGKFGFLIRDAEEVWLANFSFTSK